MPLGFLRPHTEIYTRPLSQSSTRCSFICSPPNTLNHITLPFCTHLAWISSHAASCGMSSPLYLICYHFLSGSPSSNPLTLFLKALSVLFLHRSLHSLIFLHWTFFLSIFMTHFLSSFRFLLKYPLTVSPSLTAICNCPCHPLNP